MDRPVWQKIAFAAVAFLLVSWLSYNYYFKARFKEAKELKKLLKSVEKEIGIIKPTDIISSGSSATVQDIDNALKKIGQKIPNEIDLPYMMEDFIAVSSKGLNIDYALVQPLAPVQEKDYMRIPVAIEMSAGFEDLNLYLARLDGLNNIAKISDLSIVKNNENQMLDIKMTVSLFAMSGGATSASKEAKANMAQLPSINPFFQSHFKTASSAKLAKQYKKRRVSLPKFKGIYEGEVTKVFINYSIAGIGETVDGFKIIDIGDQKVIVSKGGIRYTLKLGR